MEVMKEAVLEMELVEQIVVARFLKIVAKKIDERCREEKLEEKSKEPESIKEMLDEYLNR